MAHSMKRFTVSCILVVAAVAGTVARAAEPPFALVYQGEFAVLAGSATLCPLDSQGVLLLADVATSPNLYVGRVSGPLHRAMLSRFDRPAGLAYVSFGDEAPDAALQTAHRKRSVVVDEFVGVAASTSGADISAEPVNTEPFLIKIDGKPLDGGVIELKVKRRQSTFMLEVVRLSSVGAWQVDIGIESQPGLLFRRKKKDGTDERTAPSPRFQYAYRYFFQPMSRNVSLSVPVEVSTILKESYEWKIQVNSKDEKVEKTVVVNFKN